MITKHKLEPPPNFSKEIGFYLDGMNEVRQQLREIVGDLDDEFLRKRLDENSNSIGELILHIGEAEWWWIQCLVAGKELTEAEKKTAHWDILINRDFAAKNYSAEDCLNAIGYIRQLTTEVLSTFNDDDLERTFSYETGWSNGKNEASLRWILHHLIDHEAHHKGQIMMIKRLIK
jgi:uncharacterized damage-inducible protein DinB